MAKDPYYQMTAVIDLDETYSEKSGQDKFRTVELMKLLERYQDLDIILQTSDESRVSKLDKLGKLWNKAVLSAVAAMLAVPSVLFAMPLNGSVDSSGQGLMMLLTALGAGMLGWGLFQRWRASDDSFKIVFNSKRNWLTIAAGGALLLGGIGFLAGAAKLFALVGAGAMLGAFVLHHTMAVDGLMWEARDLLHLLGFKITGSAMTGTPESLTTYKLSHERMPDGSKEIEITFKTHDAEGLLESLIRFDVLELVARTDGEKSYLKIDGMNLASNKIEELQRRRESDDFGMPGFESEPSEEWKAAVKGGKHAYAGMPEVARFLYTIGFMPIYRHDGETLVVYTGGNDIAAVKVETKTGSAVEFMENLLANADFVRVLKKDGNWKKFDAMLVELRGRDSSGSRPSGSNLLVSFAAGLVTLFGLAKAAAAVTAFGIGLPAVSTSADGWAAMVPAVSFLAPFVGFGFLFAAGYMAVGRLVSGRRHSSESGNPVIGIDQDEQV